MAMVKAMRMSLEVLGEVIFDRSKQFRVQKLTGRSRRR